MLVFFARAGLALLILPLLFSSCQQATTLPCLQICTVELHVVDGASATPFCNGGTNCLLGGYLGPPCIEVSTHWALKPFPMKITWGDITLFDGSVSNFSNNGTSSVQLSRCLAIGDINSGALDGLSIKTTTFFFIRNSPLCSDGTNSTECQCLLYRLEVKNQKVTGIWDRTNCKVILIISAYPVRTNNTYECTPCANAMYYP